MRGRIFFLAAFLAATLAASAALVRSDKGRIVAPDGRPLQLRGVNLGSWFLLEMWMLGRGDIPDQKTFVDILRERFGDGGASVLVEKFRESWITEEDFERIREAGLNTVRVPLHHEFLETGEAFAWIDRLLGWAEKHGLWVILDLHGAPGGQSVEQPTGEVKSNRLWNDADNCRRTVEIWRAIARRYKNDPRIAAYDILNEPYGEGASQEVEPVLLPLVGDILAAIRGEGDRHLVFVPATLRGPFFYPDSFWKKWPGTGITEHFYPALYGGERTVEEHGRFIATALAARERLAARLGVPFLVGEYNVVLEGAGGDRMMRTYADFFERLGWAHTFWTYKTITPEGGMPADNWPLVTNARPIQVPDPRTVSREELGKFFEGLRTTPWEMDAGLRDVFTKKDFPSYAFDRAPEPARERPAAASDAWKSWTGANVGGATPAGGAVREAKSLRIFGGGWDINEGDDAFYFLSREADGDFEMTVTLDDFTAAERYAKAGLMVRASAAPDAPFALLHAFPDGGLIFATRGRSREKITQRLLGQWGFPVRLRAERRDGVVRFFARGVNGWESAGQFPLAGPVLAGLAVCSHDPASLASVRTTDFSFSP